MIVTIDFHSRKKNTMEVSGAKVPIVLHNIFLCVHQKKEIIQVCNNLKVSKWWQNFHFWVEYPFKISQDNLKQTLGFVFWQQSV